MTAVQIAMLSGFTILMALGQILFKMTAEKAPEELGLSNAILMARIPEFWLALVLYGIATVLWVLVLQKVPLSRAYIFLAFAFVLVPVMASFLFGEKLTGQFALGTALIMAGIIIAGFAQQA